MSRERLLAGSAAVVLALALLTATLAPGVLASPAEDDPVRPGPVGVEEVAIAHGDVGGATAELRLHARIDHDRNPTDNVSVRFRAYDAESGLLAAERTVDVGTLTGDASVPVNATLRVDREGGYRLETTVFRDGRRVDRSSTEVRGMEALTPAYAETDVRFTESDVVPPVAVSVDAVEGDRTTLRVAASLTNAGDAPSEDLRVELLLRQADSNLVADRTSVDVGDIRPGRTTDAATTLTVPANYNYYVDAALYKDGVLVDSARSVANLDPRETISANETEREIEFSVGDFADGGGGADRPTNGAEETSYTQTPGFTAALAVVALLAAALFARRRTND
ncbi:PGF-CTERM sorting domain-containing protein [Halorarum halophilum]|uniref:PGF-CTERM sorting domain-containing protein n=1 Tax=Halorarum halophilum TaxID=2743090 RepID=A0A7D5K5Q2_9EURY|nr:PGF-CTERM sorting domain-containing protein [Halobaculum halophilum]QLG26154.1 PGF-CTERM sorting domain-containing protein [Halobaculum halophilum]